MGRAIHKLAALFVTQIKKPGLYCDGGGLYLKVAKTGSKSWVFRYKINGNQKSNYLGLGSTTTFSLSEARVKALDCRKLRAENKDPLQEKRQLIISETIVKSKQKTFRECAETYIKTNKKGWKNPKHIDQWKSTLATYVYPTIGHLNVSDIDTEFIMKILEPIWATKTETASRVRGRIEVILNWAKTRKYREGDNPATWKGHLDNLLPAPKKVTKPKNHPALPYAELPKFMKELRGREGISARALEFGILTATRSGEIRNATWDEINIPQQMWIIPASRMKAGKEHRIPLNNEAMEILNTLPRTEGSNLLFPGQKKQPLSDSSLSAVIKRIGRNDITQHGFRSTFRDWTGEETSHPREVAEHALAHQLEDKAEAAYARGDLLMKRSFLMRDWGKYCYSEKGSVRNSVSFR